MGQVNQAVLLFSRSVVSSFIFLTLVVLPIELTRAQEDEETVKVCSPASTVIIATDGGVVDISALDDTEVARVSGAKGSTDSVVSELKEVCGFSSFVLVDGNSSQGSNDTSAISQRVSDKYTDPVADAILDACNYSVALVEVRKDDVCVDVPVCGDDRAHPWLDNEAHPWLDKEAHPWLDKQAHPWLDNKGFVWSDNRAHPWLDLNASPWISSRDVCIDDLGYLWSGGYGYLWSGGYGYLWSGGYTPTSSENKASPWLEAETRGVPWVD